MSASVLYMSMSLDGYIADPNDFLGGDDGQRLHKWFAPGGEFVQPSGPAGAVGRRSERDRCGRRRTADCRAHGSLGW